jgi:phosphatidylserine/phosphatidylglycerophosphate/cardiolipin synthase-like enzyme
MTTSFLAIEQQPQNAATKELKLFSESDYFKALLSDIKATKAGDRIGLITMSFEPNEPLVNEILEELYAAADRKVNVALAVDAFTFLVNDIDKTIGPLWLPLPFGQQNYLKRKHSLDKLASKRYGKYAIINKPARYMTNPYAGRSHLKTAVVNNTIYLGGPNLHKTDRSDMVVSLEDSKTADWLYNLTCQLISHQHTDKVLAHEDKTIKIDPKTQILIDAGKSGQSLIIEEAAHLIEEAREKIIASFQYFPDGIIANRLADANTRGVEVTALTNHPYRYGAILKLTQRWARLRAKSKMPDFYNSSVTTISHLLPYLHTKAITSERTAIVGTHNLVEKGVRYGTAEIALKRSNDPYFAHRVGQLLLEQAGLAGS